MSVLLRAPEVLLLVAEPCAIAFAAQVLLPQTWAASLWKALDQDASGIIDTGEVRAPYARRPSSGAEKLKLRHALASPRAPPRRGARAQLALPSRCLRLQLDSHARLAQSEPEAGLPVQQ